MSGLVVSNAMVKAGRNLLIDRVSMVAASGQLTCLIGPNGAGKSTLMQAALGLVPLSSGSVLFDGCDLPVMDRRERAQRAAFVEQSGSTETQLSARDVVLLGRIPFQSLWQTEPSADDIKTVDQALSATGMSTFADRSYNGLSGGEQQRLQIARALAQDPRLILLDEPTNHLDVHAQLAILDLLQRRARAGATVLLALHDLNLAASFCDSLVVLHHGSLVTQGPPETVLTPALLRDVYGVPASIIPHPISGRPLVAYHGPQQIQQDQQ